MTTKKDLAWDEISSTIANNKELFAKLNETEKDELLEEMNELLVGMQADREETEFKYQEAKAISNEFDNKD